MMAEDTTKEGTNIVNNNGEKSSLSVMKTETGFCSSFKSKRYRDKLRSEIKSLETLLPVNRSILHRKLDSQTVFRLVISYFRTKVFFKGVLGDGRCQARDKAVAEERDIAIETKECSTENFDELFRGDNALQALDGFLLLAMSDGTILFASDSVLQYLGFNQVDLMHRCLYSIIHPDDHYDVRDVLEKTIPRTNQHRSFQESVCGGRQTGPESISFLCRMRSFSGTSASYLKIHCAGRILRVSSLAKTAKSPNLLLYLFCRPFMISGQDSDCDVKQNVFWTKHDMDLTFKQLDKKAADIIGYVTEDLDGDSFYQHIHVEDITTCCICHKALTESSDIQTMYFRMKSKDGSWVWLHSRGKVVTKNSKKYSIVFSHSPVREEDSGYIQQEILLRQRYSVHELFFLKQNNYHLDNPASSDSMFEVIDQQLSSKNPTGQRAVQSLCPTTTGLDGLISLQAACPSSWHAMSDRHSPVLPSTHVAHKLSLREKQIHFQDFKKRQFEQNRVDKTLNYPNRNLHTGYVDGLPQGPGFATGQSISYDRFPETGEGFQTYIPSILNNCPVVPHAYCQYRDGLPSNQLSSAPCPEHVRGYYGPGCSENSCENSYPSTASILPFDMPPSPPPSPHQPPHQSQPAHQPCMFQDRTVRVRNVLTHHPSGGITWVQDQTYHVRNHRETERNNNEECSKQNKANSSNPMPSYRMQTWRRHKSRHKLLASRQKSQEKHFTSCLQENAPNSTDVMLARKLPDSRFQQQVPEHSTHQREAISCTIPESHSCAVVNGWCDSGEVTPSCFDPAFHMKIVEETDQSSKADIDLPSIGSFLEYLNDI